MTTTKLAPPSQTERAIKSARNEKHRIALERLFSRIGELTTLPSQASRLLTVTETSGITVEEIVDIVKSDAPTTMRVLRRVNSAFYSLPNKVDDIALAVNLLGMKEMRNIALTANMSRVFCGGDALAASGAFNREELWVYSVAVAMASFRIAELGGLVNPNTAYSAGLLHDIGYYLLDQHLQRFFLRLVGKIKQSAAEGTTITELEEKAFTFDHASLGAYVASQWDLSDAIAASIGYHHRFEDYEGNHRAIVATVALADFLAARQGWTALGLDGPVPDTNQLQFAAGVAHVELSQLEANVAHAIDQAATASASR